MTIWIYGLLDFVRFEEIELYGFPDLRFGDHLDFGIFYFVISDEISLTKIE